MKSQNWKQLGEAEHTRLAAKYPLAIARDILRAAKGQVIYEQLPADARGEVDRIVAELQGEFQTGGALAILRAADKSANHAERTAKTHTPKPVGKPTRQP